MTLLSGICRLGNVQYGTVKFPSTLRSSLVSEVIPSNDGYSSKLRKVMVRVEAAFIYPDDPDEGVDVDDWLEAIRDELQQPRKKLIFTGQGFGDLTVEAKTDATPTALRDRMGGPRPRLLSWNPIVANKAVTVVWECEVNLTICEDVDHEFLDFSFTRNFTINRDGAQTIRTTGSMEIPRTITAASPAQSAITVSEMRGMVTNLFEDVVAGFHREQDFSENNAGTKLDFVITDTEIASDNPFMPYVIDMELKHRMKSSLLETDATRGAGMRSWANVLSGSVTIPKGVPRIFAWMAFLAVFRDRTDVSRGTTKITAVDENGDEYTVDTNFVILDMEIIEPTHSANRGREFEFSISWLGTCELKHLFAVSKMFEPVTAFTESDGMGGQQALPIADQWAAWDGTVASIASNPYGTLGVASKPLQVIFDTCIAEVDPEVPYALTTPLADVSESALTETESDKSGIDVYSTSKPFVPSKSWVDYKNDLTVIRDSQIVKYRRVADVDTDTYKDTTPGGSANPNAYKTEAAFTIAGRTTDPQAASRDETVIANGADSFRIRMSGSAYRVGEKIPMPRVVTVGGKAVYPVGRQVMQHTHIGGPPEQPLFRARWILTYEVEGSLMASDVTGSIDASTDAGYYA